MKTTFSTSFARFCILIVFGYKAGDGTSQADFNHIFSPVLWLEMTCTMVVLVGYMQVDLVLLQSVLYR